MKLKKKTGNSTPKNPKKQKPGESVQSWLGIKAVRNGVIELSNGRYVRILEVKPIHFALRSAEEQANICLLYTSCLCWRIYRIGACSNTITTQNPSGCPTVSVSYTHLDVYKRQVYTLFPIPVNVLDT